MSHDVACTIGGGMAAMPLGMPSIIWRATRPFNAGGRWARHGTRRWFHTPLTIWPLRSRLRKGARRWSDSIASSVRPLHFKWQACSHGAGQQTTLRPKIHWNCDRKRKQLGRVKQHWDNLPDPILIKWDPWSQRSQNVQISYCKCT